MAVRTIAGHHHSLAELAAPDAYEINISRDLVDHRWDAWVARASGGHYLQTSLWAQAKATAGWRVLRLVVQSDTQIVAGAQILVRSLPMVGAVGYVPRGPLFQRDDARLQHLAASVLKQIARQQRIRFLAVQPATSAADVAGALQGAGFRPSTLELIPAATVLIDLSQDIETIKAHMSPKTRYNIRLAGRRGVHVREGTAADLPTFYRLLRDTSRRQSFATFGEEYFAALWRIFEPMGHVKLLLAECDGEVVSAMFLIAFGSMVTYWRGAWSGKHGRCHPNEQLQISAITWAKSKGYQLYDFEGIDLQAARALSEHGELSPSHALGVTAYKLGFGGAVSIAPSAYVLINNPVLRWAYFHAAPKLSSSRAAIKLENAIRGAKHG